MGGTRRRSVLGIAMVLVLSACASSKSGAGDAPEATAALRILGGTVEVQAPSAEFAPATDGQTLLEGFTVRTSAGSRAVIEYFDGSVTRLDENTTFTIVTLQVLDNEAQSKVIEGEQTSGSSYSRVADLTDSASRFDVATPTATASVQGTVYAILLNPDGSTTVAVIEGQVNVLNTGGNVVVPTGLMVELAPDGSFGDPVPIPDELLDSDWIVFNQCELDGEGNCPVTIGPLASIEISPESAVVESGEPQVYSAEGFDAQGNSLGAVAAAYEITDGECDGASCATAVPGEHTVTASFAGFTDSATLMVGGVGELIVTLDWDGPADLDLWVTSPTGETVRHDSGSADGGHLVADANKDCEAGRPVPPEQVVWAPGTASAGGYTITVNYWSQCGAGAVAFSVSATVGGDLVLSASGILLAQGSSFTTGFSAAGVTP